MKKENNNEIKTDALVKEEKSYGGEERPETEIWKDEATPENSENITSTEKLDYSNENKNEENDAIWDLKVDDLRI